MRTLTVRNLSPVQIAAFADLFPNLSGAETLGGTPLVQQKGASAIVLQLHPAVFGTAPGSADTAGRLARAAVRLFHDNRPAGVKAPTVAALASKLNSSTLDPV